MIAGSVEYHKLIFPHPNQRGHFTRRFHNLRSSQRLSVVCLELLSDGSVYCNSSGDYALVHSLLRVLGKILWEGGKDGIYVAVEDQIFGLGKHFFNCYLYAHLSVKVANNRFAYTCEGHSSEFGQDSLEYLKLGPRPFSDYLWVRRAVVLTTLFHVSTGKSAGH